MVNKSLDKVHPTDNICRIFRPNSKAHFNQPSTVNWYYCFSYMSKWPILQQTLKNSEGATNDGACRGRVQGRGPLHEVRRWYIYQHQARDMHNHSNSSVENDRKILYINEDISFKSVYLILIYLGRLISGSSSFVAGLSCFPPQNQIRVIPTENRLYLLSRV